MSSLIVGDDLKVFYLLAKGEWMIGSRSNEDSQDMVESCTLKQLVSCSSPEHQIKLLEIVKKEIENEPSQGNQGKKAVDVASEDDLKLFHHLTTNKWVVGVSDKCPWAIDGVSARSRPVVVSLSAEKLVSRSSAKNQRYLLTILENNLRHERSELTLFCTDRRGGKTQYDRWDSWHLWKGYTSDAERFSDEFVAEDKPGDVLSGDQRRMESATFSNASNNEERVVGFIGYMMNECMTDKYADENGITCVVSKSHMDAFLMEQFVKRMNDVYGGLNEEQCKQVNESVIAGFNVRAKRHAQGDLVMKLSLERALSHGVMTLRKNSKEQNYDSGLDWERLENKRMRDEGEDAFDDDFDGEDE